MLLAEIITIESGCYVVIGALVAVVTMLWGRQTRQSERVEKELDKCRAELRDCYTDRRQLSDRVLKLEYKEPQ